MHFSASAQRKCKTALRFCCLSCCQKKSKSPLKTAQSLGSSLEGRRPLPTKEGTRGFGLRDGYGTACGFVPGARARRHRGPCAQLDWTPIQSAWTQEPRKVTFAALQTILVYTRATRIAPTPDGGLRVSARARTADSVCSSVCLALSLSGLILSAIQRSRLGCRRSQQESACSAWPED